MKIEIDPNSGFCFGVINAITQAEKILEKEKYLYCLGNIVHNYYELERLKQKGLIIINYDEFKQIKNQKVLIRAHGEPPQTYKIAKENNITLIDATCPVVLKLQKLVKAAYLNTLNDNGKVVIFGKKGHAEVIGLMGQTENKAIIIENINDLNYLDFSKPIYLFAQTTSNYEKYKEISELIINKQKNYNVYHKIYYTICNEVIKRENNLKNFVKNYDAILFASSKESSNGKTLFNICKSNNPNSFFITNINEINSITLKNYNSIGITGATSTPIWFLEKIKNYLKNITNYV